jgi:hypothetical protein
MFIFAMFSVSITFMRQKRKLRFVRGVSSLKEGKGLRIALGCLRVCVYMCVPPLPVYRQLYSKKYATFIKTELTGANW